MKTLFLSLLLLGAASCSAQRNAIPKATKPATCDAANPGLKNIRVLSRTRAVSGPDTAMCTGWTLGPAQIAAILRSGNAISAETLHAQFDFLSCNYRGVVQINGCRFDFAMNAGSWFSLTRDDKTGYFGCYGKQTGKFFISTPERSE